MNSTVIFKVQFEFDALIYLDIDESCVEFCGYQLANE